MSEGPEDTLPDENTPEARLRARAGEYVLGVLSPEEQASVGEEASRDPALARAIAEWETLLDPLADTLRPAAPNARLWSAIATGMRAGASAAAPVASPVPAPAQRRPRFGFGTGMIAGALVAAGVALALWLARPAIHSGPVFAASAYLVAQDEDGPVLRVQALRDGTVTVVPQGKMAEEAGHELVFWAWPGGHGKPVALGVLGADGGSFALPSPPQEGEPVMVTREAAGSRAWPKPGPTRYLGLLVKPG